MRKFIAPWSFALGFMILSCGDADYKEKKTIGGPPSYFVVREGIIKPQCISCHPQFESHAELMKMVDPGKAESSDLFKVIDSDEMPPTGKKVPKEKKIYLKNWIEEGANL